MILDGFLFNTKRFGNPFRNRQEFIYCIYGSTEFTEEEAKLINKEIDVWYEEYANGEHREDEDDSDSNYMHGVPPEIDLKTCVFVTSRLEKRKKEIKEIMSANYSKWAKEISLKEREEDRQLFWKRMSGLNKKNNIKI